MSGMRVGYIAGVSDNSVAALEQLGIEVSMIDPASLPNANLRGYSAIVIGPRAYETQPALVANNARVLDYARQGGTLVVQYGQYEMQQPGIMPYPITINRPHDRVTNENAPVTILDSAAAVVDFYRRVHQRIDETVELLTFVGAAPARIAAELRTTLVARDDWPEFPTGPLARGERRESLNFVMYDIEQGRFVRIRSARFRRL